MGQGGPSRPRTVSVVIPARDEEAAVAAAVGSALAGGRRAPGLRVREVIVVDGGSADGTRRAARRAGARVLAWRGPGCRGAQLNAGAARARGDLLLFLHADSRLPPGYRAALQARLARQPAGQAPWGAFARLAIDGRGGEPRYRAVEAGAALRSRLLDLPCVPRASAGGRARGA